jgi:hypothetical protein
VLTTSEERSLTIEAESAEEAAEWRSAITDAIRTANISSLVHGNRVPQAVQWYVEEYALYVEAMKILEFGHLFKLHFIEKGTSAVHLIKVWLQASSNGFGLVFYVSVDGLSSVPSRESRPSASPRDRDRAMAPAEYIDGLEVNFHEISSITKGTSENVVKSKDMGPDRYCVIPPPSPPSHVILSKLM